jgi:CheY-like chemotaxis protein
MGQARAHRPIALVVEDDASQRVLVTTLLEESEMSVIQCESAEAAELVMNKIGARCRCCSPTSASPAT